VFDAVGKRKTSAFKVACAAALTPGGKYASVDDRQCHHHGPTLAPLDQSTPLIP